jgi:glucose-1-phosphatase
LAIGKILINTVLFDLGGVVLDVDFNRVFKSLSDYSQSNMQEIKERFSFDTAYEKFERGEIDSEGYFQSLRDSLKINISDDEFIKSWNNIFRNEIQGINELLVNIKPEINLYAFSNTNEIHFEYLIKKFSKTLSSFKEIFVSFKIQKRKPEIDSYLKVAKLMNSSLDEILFFDDLEENVVAAKKLGIQTVLVEKIEDIKNAIRKYNLNKPIV